MIATPSYTSTRLIHLFENDALTCTLDADAEDFYQSSREWAEDVQDMMSDLLESFSSRTANVNPSVYDLVKRKMTASDDVIDVDKMLVTFDEKDKAVTIAGSKKAVKKNWKKIEALIAEIEGEQDLSRRKVWDVLQEQLQTNFPDGAFFEELIKRKPNVKFAVESVFLSGEERYELMKKVKRDVKDFMEEIPHQTVAMSSSAKTLLTKSRSIQVAILTAVQDRQLIWNASEKVDGVIMYALNERDLDIGVRTIQQEIQQHRIPVKKSKQESSRHHSNG